MGQRADLLVAAADGTVTDPAHVVGGSHVLLERDADPAQLGRNGQVVGVEGQTGVRHGRAAVALLRVAEQTSPDPYRRGTEDAAVGACGRHHESWVRAGMGEVHALFLRAIVG
jgi:hypothetical protein